MIELLLIPADYEVPYLIFRLDDPDDEAPIRSAVGGFTQTREAGPALLIMNEDGSKALHLSVNHRATVLWEHFIGGPAGDVLIGEVLVAGPEDVHGNLTSCPAEILAMVGLRR